ncbi:MAG: hypothetical protein EZS28_030847 [Streblomastix strix]|uniref:Uncharacterized protein n=1 Tax=Streblomastix strix TaxID=222440 RepID=A0A5J4USI8_9EUKA|nr:MAG: hypothetical protein EZS28_030847 [Streblomastix strix]
MAFHLRIATLETVKLGKHAKPSVSKPKKVANLLKSQLPSPFGETGLYIRLAAKCDLIIAFSFANHCFRESARLSAAASPSFRSAF